MKIKTFLVFAINIATVVAVGFFSSCGSKPSAGPSKTDLLTGGSGMWKIMSLGASYLGQSIDLLQTLDACEKDDLYYYKKDMTYQILEGATKCDPSSPSVKESGTWKFSADQTQLISQSSVTGSPSEAVTLQTLSSTTLTVKTKLEYNGIMLDVTASYVKQ